MKYLASGYQYNVYDLETGRVLKKIRPYLVTLIKVYKLERRKNSNYISLCNAVRSGLLNKQALLEMQKRVAGIPGWIFANPLFVDGSLNFTQDKVTILKDVLSGNDFKLQKQIIDKYIDLQKLLWSFGVHDAVYKPQLNYGIDKEGRVVCIDFGEFLFVKEAVLKNIESERWLTRPSNSKWLESETKRYYISKMRELMTRENLEKYWKDSMPPPGIEPRSTP